MQPLYLAMSPHGTDGPSPIQRAAAGIGYSTIALHHHPASACDISIRNVRTHYFLDKREDGVTAAPAKPLTKARSMALSRSEPPRSLSISATRRSNALAALMRPSSSRHVAARKQLPRVALCERRRAGFARLSGWQPVGNWVASAGNFPASLLPVGVIRTTSRRMATLRAVDRLPMAGAAQRPAAEEHGVGLFRPVDLGWHAVNWMKNRRSLWTRPRIFGCGTISCCLSAAFSASSRLLDLKS